MASNWGIRSNGFADIACVCFIAFGLCQRVSAQVPVHLEPRHPVVFENEAFRVLNVNIEGGDTTLDHVHANDIAIVCISGCEIRTRLVGGDWGDWLARLPGQFFVNANAGQPSTHRHQAGTNLYHVVSVENLRQSGWSQGASVSGPATKLVNETRAFQIYDVRLGAGASEASHVHAHPVVAILVSGEVLVDGRGRQGTKALLRSAEWAFISAGGSHRIVNRGSTDAYVVEVEVR